jgi:aarF domain-containing kinase
MEGERLDRAQFSSASKGKVASILSRVFTKMIFEEGWVHGDPHEANFVWDEGRQRLALLDHALYQTLDEPLRRGYTSLWSAMLRRDEPGIKAACAQLGKELDPHLFAEMIVSRPYQAIIAEGDPARMLNLTPEQIASVQRNAMLKGKQITHALHRMDRQLFLVFKVNDMVRWMVKDLGRPELFITETAAITDRLQGHSLLARLVSSLKLRLGLLLYGAGS